MKMVERVARAIALADLDDETRAAVDLDAHMAHVRQYYEELARAAIVAMRDELEAYLKYDEEGVPEWIDEQLAANASTAPLPAGS